MKITELHNVSMPPALVKTSAPKVSVPDTPADPPMSPPKCRVLEQPDGGLQVSFLVEPDVAARLLKRANGMDTARYMWENILHRAVEGHVY